MTHDVSTVDLGGPTAVHGAARSRKRATTSRLSADQVWAELRKASFAIVSYVTPGGEPRSSGIVYAVEGRHIFLAVAPDSWKARQIGDDQQVAVTVPVRRGGLLSILAPIPPATISFHARAIVHPAGSLALSSVSKSLRSLLPKDRRDATLLELAPEGAFLTYGIGVPLMAMRNPVVARAHVPIA
jgi:hypothetical protein